MTIKTEKLLEEQVANLNDASGKLMVLQLEFEKIALEFRHLKNVAMRENKLMEKGEKDEEI